MKPFPASSFLPGTSCHFLNRQTVSTNHRFGSTLCPAFLLAVFIFGLRLLISRKRCRHAFAARSAHRRLTGPSPRVASSRHGFGEALSLLYVGPLTLRRREQEGSMNRAIPDLPYARPTDARLARFSRAPSNCYGVACRSRERIAVASSRLWQLGTYEDFSSTGCKKGSCPLDTPPIEGPLRGRVWGSVR